MEKRYSSFIKPLMLLIDLIIINSVLFYISDKEYLNTIFLIYSNLFWVFSTLFTGFYKVYRYTKVYRIFSLLAFQFIIFFLGFFAFFTLFREGEVVNNQTLILTLIFISISFFKLLFIFALKKYRASGKNYRKVIVLGLDSSSKKVIQLFNTKKELGYVFSGFFSDKDSSKKGFLGNIENSFNYVLENEIDEIYCTLSVLNKEQIKMVTKFANENNRVLKLIPEANELYSKNLNTEYYGDSSLILNVRKLPFEYSENHFIKRVFDILFSVFTIVFVLSWLTPIIWILIKLESKGPAFFKQKREGLNGQQFVCYKFRSMRMNLSSTSGHTKKNDQRVTKFGTFLRRTSLDELPQFFNVIRGNMSVVGPRPHLKSLSIEYQKDVGNYMERHAVKPGITGLAQVSGYRGEIKKKSDIKNRIRFDIFYIENWSFLLDLKIIFQTVFNVFKGDEKAY
jgi:putative colanic acid biosynthesis UDP-glucose lipid carrier transferase